VAEESYLHRSFVGSVRQGRVKAETVFGLQNASAPNEVICPNKGGAEREIDVPATLGLGGGLGKSDARNFCYCRRFSSHIGHLFVIENT
jgi:hypothetical protein